MTIADKVVVTKYNNKTVVIGMKNHSVISINAFDEKKDPIGTVYLGRVEKILSNIGSCFVMYKKGECAFLKSDKYKCSQIIPVMLKNYSGEDKKDTFTDDISIAGDLAVVKKGTGNVFISSKLGFNDSERIKNDLSNRVKEKDIDIIVRTKAAEVSLESLIEEITKLIVKLESVYELALTRKQYAVLYKPVSDYIRKIRELSDTDTEIITDDIELHKDIFDNFSSYIMEDNIRLYDDKQVSLYTLYKIEGLISSVLSDTVYLKSGAYLYIESTKALTAIDVNTGKVNKGVDSSETFLNVNIEAAREIAKQLKFRNISGIIVIDFINMKDSKLQDILIENLKKYLKDDPVKVNFVDITGLGLIELTRKRISLPIKDILKGENHG